MEEVFQKPAEPIKKNHKKRNLTIVLIILVILSFLFLGYNQIMNFSIPQTTSNGETVKEEVIAQYTCQERMSEWCNLCFSVNYERRDLWEVSGTQIGNNLALCSNTHFGTSWTSEQDCTAALSYCSQLLGLQNE